MFGMCPGPVAYEGGRPPPPSTRAPPERLRGAMEEALLILHLLAFPFLRPGTVTYLSGSVVLLPPLGVPRGAKRKLRLESNT